MSWVFFVRKDMVECEDVMEVCPKCKSANLGKKIEVDGKNRAVSHGRRKI